MRKHYLADCSTHAADGMASTEAQARSLYRVFGSKPGTYGAGILTLLDERNWRSDQDLAAVYVAWGGYAYTQTTTVPRPPANARRALHKWPSL